VETPATLSHEASRTPILTKLTPNQGTARGGTEVLLHGSGLQPLGVEEGTSVAESVQVFFNGYPCTVLEANETQALCVTSERDSGITAPSTSVWVAGRGRALVAGENSEATTFQYIDKWSNIYSWLDSEPPVDGDSVIVPQGQSILLDQDSPLLFFVLIQGLLQFDRKDLNFDATYIWISGGHLSVGSEEVPFLHRATITLHGDRWWTIELPFIGCKNLVVTNAGGLHGGCHTLNLRHSGEAATPCYVRRRRLATCAPWGSSTSMGGRASRGRGWCRPSRPATPCCTSRKPSIGPSVP